MRNRLLKCLAGICYTGLATATLPAASSPMAETDLICHTSVPAECYPRIFQPTEDFQVVHGDQDLPPGLHVRLNIYTGLKEARLNIPTDDGEENQNIEAGQAIVVVPEPEQEISDATPNPSELNSRKPPPYENVGKVSPPRDAGTSGDSGNFYRAIDLLSEETQASDMVVGSALADLFDLSHDIFYGVELLRKNGALQKLVSLMAGEGLNSAPTAEQRQQAASILANSLQNNPTALKEFRNSWKALMQPVCDGRGIDNCEDGLLTDNVIRALETEQEPSAMRAKIGTLSGLSKNQGIRDDFLAKNGMELLLSIFLKEGVRWDGTRVKIARFIMDTFLDENMGADLGVWPTQAAADSTFCEQRADSVHDGCWEHHLEKMTVAIPSYHEDNWRVDFLRLLRESNGRQRRADQSPPDREL